MADDTTEVLGSAEEAHRIWPAGLAKRAASKAKVVPPGDFALFFYQCLSESIGGWCFEWWRLGFFSGF